MKTASARPGRGRPRLFDTDAALEAAMLLFWQRGYAGTSMTDLLSAMNINAPSLYAAFGDKRRLFEASIEHYQAGPGSFAAQALAGGGTARDAIEHLLREAARTFANPSLPHGCMVVCAAINCSPHDEPTRQSLQNRRKRAEDMIRARIERGVADGDLTAHTDTVALASFVATVFQGLSIQALDGASSDTLQAVVTQSMAAWPKDCLKDQQFPNA